MNSVFIGTSNELGELESGMLACLIGTVPAAAAVGGFGTLLVMAPWTHWFPELRDRDRLIP